MSTNTAVEKPIYHDLWLLEDEQKLAYIATAVLHCTLDEVLDLGAFE